MPETQQEALEKRRLGMEIHGGEQKSSKGGAERHGMRH